MGCVGLFVDFDLLSRLACSSQLKGVSVNLVCIILS